MSLIALVFPENRVKIGSVELDASISEGHRSPAQVTTNPVEVGLNVTDHIRALPARLTIRGMVSNSPLGRPGLLLDPEPTRAEDAYQTLRDLQARGELLTVATTLRDYTSMALTAVNVDRSVETGDVVLMSIELVEVRIVTSQTVAIDPSVLVVKRVGGSSSRGKKNARPAPPDVEKIKPTDDDTALLQLKDATFGPRK